MATNEGFGDFIVNRDGRAGTIYASIAAPSSAAAYFKFDLDTSDFQLITTTHAWKGGQTAVGANGNVYVTSGAALGDGTGATSLFRIDRTTGTVLEFAGDYVQVWSDLTGPFDVSQCFQGDWGDAPNSYGTATDGNGARHGIWTFDRKTNTSKVMIGTNVDSDIDSPGNAGATSDDSGDGYNDERGVSFQSYTGGPSVFQLDAHVTGTNATGIAAMLCGYLDGAADGLVNNSFSRSITYPLSSGRITSGAATAGATNEEICVPIIAGAATNRTTTAAGRVGQQVANCTTTAAGVFNCTLTWYPNYASNVVTYTRFRLTTDDHFFSNSSPSPVGAVVDGEVEDYRLDINPTAATIGAVALASVRVADVLADLGADRADAPALMGLLQAWDPQQAAMLSGAGAAELEQALVDYLDLDADGQVAVLRWETLMERGTIGFYVERREADSATVVWTRINGGMLPGLIDAPLGGEYWLADPQAQSGTEYLYRLIEQEAWGTQKEYGPFRLMLE